MKKTLIALAILVALAAAAYALFAIQKTDVSPSGDSGLDPNAPVNGIEVRGVVTAVDLEQVMLDGPYVVMVKTEDGDEEIVAVPSMGIMLCAARDAIADVSTIKEGMTIEAKGNLTSQGDIVPCESPSHYLRVVSR